MNGSERVNKVWTHDEIELLKELWGEKSLSVMAKRLKRSEEAIKIKAYKIGLPSLKDASSLVPITMICNALKYDNKHPYKTWKDMPYVTRWHGKQKINHISVENFWKWASNNRVRIDFSKYEIGSLPPEPAWIHEEIKIVKRTSKKWTTEEDAKLKYLVARGVPYTKIAATMGKTYSSIGHRVSRLAKEGKITLTKVNLRWTDEEVAILIRMKLAGNTYKEIGYELGREDFHIADKLRRVKLPAN